MQGSSISNLEKIRRCLLRRSNHHRLIMASSYSLSLPALDALPYHDSELDSKPGLRNRVERAVAEELQRGPAVSLSDARLPPDFEPFSSRPDLRELYERASRSERLDALDRTRYSLPTPPTQDTDYSEAWDDSLKNAISQLMHSEQRQTNLELMKKYGANHWRLHNFQQEAMLRHVDRHTAEKNELTNGVNRSRKRSQLEVGADLDRYNSKWAQHVSDNLQLEVANLAAQAEVDALEAQSESLAKRLKQLEAEEE